MDIFIATEHLAGADDMAGGVSGVLRPAFSQLGRVAADGGVLIIDWAGGLGSHRRSVLAATSLDSILARRGITGMTIVATTNAAEERIDEARATLAATKVVAPGFRTVIPLNKRTGGFKFTLNLPAFAETVWFESYAAIGMSSSRA